MNSKSTPISVRLGAEDLEFLKALSIEDAKTPSEKLRALLKEARELREGAADPLGRRRTLEELQEQLRQRELADGTHSELITLSFDALLGIMSYLGSIDHDALDPEDVERQLADRMLRLATAITRLGLTTEAPCYDPGLLIKRLKPLLEVANVIK